MFRLVTLREVGDAFEYAKAHASELGAGALIYVGRFDLAEFAVVLEPDEPLRSARRAFYAGMAAMADALIAQAEGARLSHDALGILVRIVDEMPMTTTGKVIRRLLRAKA